MNANRFQRAFAASVRAERARLGLRQEDVQVRAGLGRNYLTTLETGGVNPSLEAMARIADALDCPLSQLIRSAEMGVTR